MCYKIDNQEIGTYISGLIEREFKSARQFCIAYLQKNGFSEPGREDIQKMANRLSQIIKEQRQFRYMTCQLFQNCSMFPLSRY